MPDIPAFTQDAMERIKQTVRTVEGWGDRQGAPGGLGGRGGDEFGRYIGVAVSLVVGATPGTYGTLAQFYLATPGTTKGSEAATSTTVTAFVRKGLVFPNVRYTLLGVCGSGDAILEVVDPDLSFRGKTDASHAKGTSGTVSIWYGGFSIEVDSGQNMTGVDNQYGDVASGKWVRCSYCSDANGWELVAAECT